MVMSLKKKAAPLRKKDGPVSPRAVAEIRLVPVVMGLCFLVSVVAWVAIVDLVRGLQRTIGER